MAEKMKSPSLTIQETCHAMLNNFRRISVFACYCSFFIYVKYFSYILPYPGPLLIRPQHVQLVDRKKTLDKMVKAKCKLKNN